jgi:two-component system chemotaxis sensor kinase CheA
VLDLSKIEAGRMSIVVEEVEVAGLLKSVEALFAPLAQGKGVAISCSVHPAVPKTIFSAGDRVKQILRNFVSNAVKFVETGSIELLAEPPDEKYWQALRGDEALAAEAERRPQEFIVFAVRDTGIGIPEERQQAIFEAFRQADGTTSRRYGGTGLGLSIVSNFAALLGGGVGLWSTVAEGSTFFALLPIVSEEHTSALIAAPTAQQLRQIEPVDGTFAEETVVAITEITTNSEETEARPAGWGDGRRLLVVDDDVRNTYALTIALEAEGFVVVAAGNGRDALDTLDKDTSFSAVLMDIMMPEMDGYEAMRILRADSRFAALPVLALTARTQEEDRAACFEAGATDFIAKPIDHDQLLSCLSAALTRLETL